MPSSSRQARSLLLASAATRLTVAVAAIAVLWGIVLWASITPPPPTEVVPQAIAPVLKAIVTSGQPAPVGGAFDRFDVTSQPVVAPVNSKGHVAFYASVIRAKATEGIFLADAARITKVAAVGDAVPGGGRLSEFAKHPVPALNDAGKVAFGAAIAGARASEGIFLADRGKLSVVALSGSEAPGIIAGTFSEFDVPALNDRDEVTFVATVRKGRETIQALYLYQNGRLKKLHASGDPAPRGGTLDKFGVPTINNKGVIAFPAVVERGAILGGIFLSGSRQLALMVAAGDLSPEGEIIVRFSERVTIDDDDNLAFSAHLTTGAGKEAIFVSGATGLTQIAKIGDAAPGGGQFSAFGAWPTLGASGALAFVAGVRDAPRSAGVYVWRGGTLERVAATGDTVKEGGALAGFALNPVTSVAPDRVTFATLGELETPQTGIYYFGPPPLP